MAESLCNQTVPKRDTSRMPKKIISEKKIEHGPDVEQTCDVEQNMHDVQRALLHAVGRVRDARAHERREHEADDGRDDAIVDRVVE